MTITIDQFMWAFQHSFRWNVEYEIKQVLTEIWIPVPDAQVVLVGMATEENTRHAICVEPETGPLRAEHFAAVTGRAEELYRLDPQTDIFYSDPRARTKRNRNLFLTARANAITEAIGRSGEFDDLTFFVSQSSPIDGYDVHTCIGIPKSVFENLPAFKESTVGRFHAGKSLQHEVIRECLVRADKALYLPNPGEDIAMILGSFDDIITSATEGFLSGTTWRVASKPSSLYRALNEVASLTYERAGARGSFIVTSPENIQRWLTVRFKNPCPFARIESLAENAPAHG